MPPPRKGSGTPAGVPLSITALDYSITVEVKHKGPTMWIKVGATADVPEGGNATRTQKSLAAWVEKLAEEKIGEMLS